MTRISPELLGTRLCSFMTEKAFELILKPGTFKKLFKLFQAEGTRYTIYFGKDEKNFRLSDEESGQFHAFVKFVKRYFIESYHNECRGVGFMFSMFPETSNQTYYHLGYYSDMEVFKNSPESMKVYPTIVKKTPGDAILLNAFVDAAGSGIIVHIRVSETITPSQQVDDWNTIFAKLYTFKYPMLVCVGCNNFMPLTKKCNVCREKFCDADCMKKSWKVHKITCKKPEEKLGEAMGALHLDQAAVDAPLLAGAADGGAPKAKAAPKAAPKVDTVSAPVCPCGAPNATKVCTGCRKQWYCSEACQKECWYIHYFAHQTARKLPKDVAPKPPQAASASCTCPECGAPMDAQGAVGARCAACSQ